MTISCLVLTLNEEQNIAACLNSLSWCADIVVLDSFSSDRTVEIARQCGARVVQRKFDNWASHQNWAMENIGFKHPWVFYMDADERMTPELKQELAEIAGQNDNTAVAYYCGRRNFFMGRWIKHAMPPSYIMRLFRPGKIRFERLVNPVPVIDGAHGYLRNYFDHFNFSKGTGEWIEKHNKYSTWEAMEGIELAKHSSGLIKQIFVSDRALRRKALKNLSFRLPFRPAIKFIYMFFFKRGFLDGGAGFRYCVLQSFYEYMIVLKMDELRSRGDGNRT